MKSVEVRAALIDAAKRKAHVIVSHRRDGLDCVVVGRVFSVSSTHVVVTLRSSETIVPLGAIVDVRPESTDEKSADEKGAGQ